MALWNEHSSNQIYKAESVDISTELEFITQQENLPENSGLSWGISYSIPFPLFQNVLHGHKMIGLHVFAE